MAQLNAFEVAIMERLARRDALIGSPRQLRVVKRTFTGAGSYTDFECGESAPDTPGRTIALHALMRMPGVPNGLGAILFCGCNEPDCPEIPTHGEER